MDRLSVPAFISVERQPEKAKMIGWTIATILCALIIISCVLMGLSYAVLGLPALGFAVNGARQAGATSEKRMTEASLTWQDPYLLVFLPSARLYDGRYVDQLYACERSQVDFAGFDQQGDFVLRARKMNSVACQGAQEIERRHMDHVEVSFKVMADHRENVSRFLVMHGLA